MYFIIRPCEQKVVGADAINEVSKLRAVTLAG
jgi:hypothetical protein